MRPRKFQCVVCKREGISTASKPRLFCSNECRWRFHNLETKRLAHEAGAGIRMPRGSCPPGRCKHCDSIRTFIDRHRQQA